MNVRFVTVGTVIALLAMVPATEAQQGEWRIGARLIRVVTNAETDPLPATGSRIAFDSATSVDFDATYLIDDNWATEIMLTTAQHGLEASGGNLDGLDLGWVWMAQATFTLQYHVPMWGKWRPYFGLGLGLAHLHNSSFNDTANSSGADALRSNLMTGVAAQAGVAYRYGKNWILTFDIKYNGASGDVRVQDVDGNTSDQLKTDFEPWIVGLGAAVRF
jgi:outer membrane protein W